MEPNKSDSPKPQIQAQTQAQALAQVQPQPQPQPQQQPQQAAPQLQPQQVQVQIQPQQIQTHQIQAQIQPQQIIQPQTAVVSAPLSATQLTQPQLQPQQVQVQIQPQQIQAQIQPRQIIQPQTAVVSAPLSATQLTQPQLQPPQVQVQIQPQQIQAQIQPRQIIQPQTAVVSAPVSASQLTQPKSSTQPACSLHICCLLDNGVRCDRDAGNASFNARIQKIVGTKKMNFALDSTVRHAYICEHHKGIITVAKKSATLARDTKTNARNCTANSNANNLVSHPHPRLDYDYSVRPQQPLQHAGNLDLLNNQNRLANNHTGALNNMPVRQGAHLAYGHFQGAHTNQVGFDNASGDSVPSSSGGIDVDLQQLQVNTLRRYKRHFRVPTRPGLNKMQLAESLKSHFRTLPIIEKEAITYFVYIVKCYRNKLDHN